MELKKKIHFCKMNGTGNDFIIINNIIEKIEEKYFSNFAKKFCDRRFSVGADGFIVVEKSDREDVKMLFYNSDGSLGEMCGNGARCLARFTYENNLCKKENEISMETTAGVVKAQRIDEINYKIKLNTPCNVKNDISIKINEEIFLVDYVELGNPGIPHIIVNIKNLKNYDKHKLFELGKTLRYDKNFYKGCNVNFYDLVEKDYLYEITYERGVEDFTYACGTGTGSLVYLLNKKNLVGEKNIRIDMMGGTMFVDLIKTNDIKDIYLTGPTAVVCEGELF